MDDATPTLAAKLQAGAETFLLLAHALHTGECIGWLLMTGW